MILVNLTVDSCLCLIVLSSGDVFVNNGWVHSLMDSSILICVRRVVNALTTLVLTCFPSLARNPETAALAFSILIMCK